MLSKILQEQLENRNLTLAISNGQKEFTSQKRGIAPLLDLVEEQGNLTNYIAYDKVVGKGAALLYVMLGIKEVYTKTISSLAYDILRANAINVNYLCKVPNIINRQGTDLCPMEKAVLNIDDPKLGYLILKTTLAQLKGEK